MANMLVFQFVSRDSDIAMKRLSSFDLKLRTLFQLSRGLFEHVKRGRQKKSGDYLKSVYYAPVSIHVCVIPVKVCSRRLLEPGGKNTAFILGDNF